MYKMNLMQWRTHLELRYSVPVDLEVHLLLNNFIEFFLKKIFFFFKTVTQGKPIETRPLKPMRITTENSASIQQSSRQSSSPPPPPPVLSNVDRAAKMELEALIRKPAHTAEEK